MKLSFLVAILVLIQATFLFASGPIKVYILAGQSNMVGQGVVKGKETPGTLEFCIANDKTGKYDFLSDKRGKLAKQEDVWIYYERDGQILTENLSPRFGRSDDLVGLEISFGYQIQKQEGEQILLIKTAWGGKSLAKDFRPPSAGGQTGFYYEEMLRCIHDALNNLGKHFPKIKNSQNYEIAGFCWHQGWNDHVSKKFTAEYTRNFEYLINDLRAEFKSNFPVVVATTGMPTKREALSGKKPTEKPIEKAQLAIANVKEFTGNVAVVDTRKYWKSIKESPAPGGGQHYHWNKSAEIYMDIGFACAEAFGALKK
ncbi:MAG: sialate O-acetylesterase [Akkermansiaceae bacterium]